MFCCKISYQEYLTDEDVIKMDWHTKASYLTSAQQINYIFKKLYKCVILSKMLPIGQIINYDDIREFQNRGKYHMYVQIHVQDAPTINEDDDADDRKVADFIEKYITCSLPNETYSPVLHQLVKQVQTHFHTNTCRKRKGVTSRFGGPQAPSQKMLIV